MNDTIRVFVNARALDLPAGADVEQAIRAYDPVLAEDVKSGAAYVIEYNSPNWTQVAKLLSSDLAEGDQFGVSVSVDGTNAVIGAQLDDAGSGSAYVFDRV